MLPYSGGESCVLFRRSPDAGLTDVVSGYVSLEAATRDSDVAVKHLGTSDQVVRPPGHYAVDEAAVRLRAGREGEKARSRVRSPSLPATHLSDSRRETAGATPAIPVIAAASSA